ncbi:MAG: pilus assembly protein [Lachnospiraceae bacterium]|nr:pilus assembly protein [Lachnospiraceae bacterium]
MARIRQIRGERRAGASSTIEAAVVMGVALAMLMAVIFIGFYLHDKCILIGAANETAQVCAEWERMEEEGSPEAYFRDRISGKLLYFPPASCSVSIGGETVCVTAAARSGRMSVSVSASAPVTCPEEEIRRDQEGG